MQFLISEDKEAGIKTVGTFLPDGKLHVQTRQYVPDQFFTELKAMKEAQEGQKRGTQKHWRAIGSIPRTLADKLLVDGNGKPLAMNDPDREKKIKQIMNDIDYRDLRIGEGVV